MITTKNYLLQQLTDNLEQEGYFWRLARAETFIDLLKFQAGKSSTAGLSDQLAVDVILITLKALINNNLGVEEFTSDYKKLNKKLFQQQDFIAKQADQILSDNLLTLEKRASNYPLAESDNLRYFKILSKVEEAEYSTAVFEEILITFLEYFSEKRS